MVSRERTQRRDKSKFRSKKENCFECGKRGHFRRDCFVLKRGKEKESSDNIIDRDNSGGSDSSVGVVLYVNSDHRKNS